MHPHSVRLLALPGSPLPAPAREAERARQAELREKAKEQLAALQGEAAAAADEAKEAAAAVK